MKNAIITLSIGEEFRSIAEITHPLIKQYADSCSADFIVINEQKTSTGARPHFEKFQIAKYFDVYDRIAYIDTDIIILPKSPNLFLEVPSNKFGACIVSKIDGRFAKEISLINQELGQIDWHHDYFNSGVMVISASHREIFNPPNDELIKWSSGDFRKHTKALFDQTLINYQLNRLGFELYDIGFRYNHTPAWNNSHKRFNSHFLHFAGSKGHRKGIRIEQIKLDYIVATSKTRLWFRRNFPHFGYILDRI